MPHSLDPEPGENETECARCGAHFSMELTRCPRCGVSLYEPEDEAEESPQKFQRPKPGLGERVDKWFHRLTKKPYAVDKLFGAAIDQAQAFDDLLGKLGGDREAAERLVEFERTQMPAGTRIQWIRNAVQRWERDQKGK